MSASIWAPGGDLLVNSNNRIAVEHFIVSDINQPTFTLTNFTYVLGTNSISVYLNGVMQRSGIDYSESSESTITFLSHTFVLGDVVSIVGQTTVTSGSANPFGTSIQSFIATTGQTVFPVTHINYTPNNGSLRVYINGLLQEAGYSYQELNGNIVFSEGLEVGDEVLASFNSEIGISQQAAYVSYTPAGTGAVATDVQSKLRESVSVKDFGAVGDGVTDDTAAIQAALDFYVNVFIPAGTYKCTSALNVTVTGQIVCGAGRDLTTLDFASSEINGLNMNGCEYARIENFTIIGTCNADTDVNAGINVINWARGTASNMRVTGFSRGITWENATRGWMLGMLDMYFYNNRMAGALLYGNAHACSFRGGEIAQGKYGIVIGQLNADGTINDDASANFGGAFSAHGTIIEGQSDYMVVIGNNQLGVKFSGCYIETVAATAPQAFFRIGSKFMNDGVTPATGYPKGVSVDGCMIYKGSATPQSAAVKLEALLGGSFIGNVIASAGPVLNFMDTSALRFSYGINSVGNEVSGGGNYVAGTSDAVQIGNREYPVTNSASGYLKQFYGWSGSTWEPTMTIPATSARGPTFHKQPVFTGGIKLDNTAPADATSMNYYETGTFAPTIIGTSTAGTGTYTQQTGSYTRVGDRVHFNLYLAWSAHTGTGNIRVSGLPFTSKNSTSAAAAVNVYMDTVVSLTAGNIIQGYVLTNSTQILITQYATGGSNAAVVPIDTAAAIIISGSYIV